jgi:hypothetical protein
MKLLREIKDIRDELHMINQIFFQQQEVIAKMNKSLGRDWVEWIPRIAEINRLDEDARRVEESVGRGECLMHICMLTSFSSYDS